MCYVLPYLCNNARIQDTDKPQNNNSNRGVKDSDTHPRPQPMSTRKTPPTRSLASRHREAHRIADRRSLWRFVWGSMKRDKQDQCKQRHQHDPTNTSNDVIERHSSACRHEEICNAVDVSADTTKKVKKIEENARKYRTWKRNKEMMRKKP